MQGGSKDTACEQSLALCSKKIAVQTQRWAVSAWLMTPQPFHPSCSLAPEQEHTSASHKSLQQGPHTCQLLGFGSCGFYEGPQTGKITGLWTVWTPPWEALAKLWKVTSGKPQSMAFWPQIHCVHLVHCSSDLDPASIVEGFSQEFGIFMALSHFATSPQLV